MEVGPKNGPANISILKIEEKLFVRVSVWCLCGVCVSGVWLVCVWWLCVVPRAD